MPGEAASRLRCRYIPRMCGRVIQGSGPLRYTIVNGLNVRDSRVHNYPPRWNAAPSQELLVIRRNHRTGEVSLDPLRWGLIPHWCSDPADGRKPINAKCETVRDLPSFRDAYRAGRCIVLVDGFFEWRAMRGQKAKQPYAIAMRDGSPSGIAGIWENWKEPVSGEGTDVRDHHDRRQRARRRHPRPHAGDTCARGLRPLAGRGA
jgi:putative SOS response-associated peptidase YedK